MVKFQITHKIIVHLLSSNSVSTQQKGCTKKSLARKEYGRKTAVGIITTKLVGILKPNTSILQRLITVVTTIL